MANRALVPRRSQLSDNPLAGRRMRAVPDLPYRYRNLADFLTSTRLSFDAEIEHGVVQDFSYAVKGREIDAAILFADISAFTSRTSSLSSAATLFLVNHFFSYISLAALRHSTGIVDKYIGDEIMVVFSDEFGSPDPVEEALQTARWMAERDPLQYCPHVGIAYGTVTVGYVGTPLSYDCSVFGAPVTLASRCAGVAPDIDARAWISLPSELWGDRSFEDLYPPTKIGVGDEIRERPHTWELRPARTVQLKGLDDTSITQIVNTSVVIPAYGIEEQMEQLAEQLRNAHGQANGDSDKAG